MPSRRISTAKLLFMLMSVSPVFSYTTSPNGPHAKPFGVQDFPSVTVKKDRVVPEQKKQTYDLGLGKNKPLYGGKRHTTAAVAEAAQFMVEHEAVNSLPSPTTTTTTTTTLAFSEAKPAAADKAPQKKKKILPKVQLKRKSEDVLNINHTKDMMLPHMTRTARSSNAKMDVNTAWVEMMIHSEQMKLKTA